MNQGDYDSLLKKVVAAPINSVPGVSKSLQDALDALSELSARWREPSDASPVGGLVLCPRHWPLDVLDELLSRCAAHSWQRLNLQPQSPVFNAGLLFGDGPRVGVLEAPQSAGAIVIGLENLAPPSLERWLIHLRVWWHSRLERSGTPPHLLQIAESGSHAAIRLCESNLLTVIHLPSLATRREDIAYLVHSEANRCEGSLADFELRAIDMLVRHDWPADWLEVRDLVQHLYENSKRDVAFTFDEDQVRRRLEILTRSLAPSPVAEPDVIWGEIRSLGDQCDALTRALLAKPFFSDKTFDERPLDCPNPQLRLSRIVSWGYKTFVDREGAADTLNALLKLPLDTQGPIEIRSACDLIQNWRTLEQHPGEPSPRNEKMRRRVAEFAKKACGMETPSEPHWEKCVISMLLELQRIFSLLLERLRSLSVAPEQETFVAQWRDYLEMSWTRHKHEQLLKQVLSDLGRTELLVIKVLDVLFDSMQRQLACYSPASDRERHLRSWLEEEIRRRFPRPPLIAADLVRLNVAPGQIEFWLQRCDRLHREQGKDRDELLALVDSELRSSPRAQGSQPVPS